MANAAAAVQLDDDTEPADAEPWVLEGWGDGPSVSEAAQQAALRLGPYVKNVPTALVGLGAGGGRRVCSAGHQGRGPLKVSEARRKPGPGPPFSQGDRRASGPPALAAGSQPATATLRRTAVSRTLDVGDESDVEPPGPATTGASAGSSYGYVTGPVAPAQNRITPAQRAGAALRQQNAQQAMQSTLNTATRLGGRREATGAGSLVPAAPATQPAAPAVVGSATGEPAGGGSPRHRSASAETYLSAAAARPPNVSGRAAPAAPYGSPGAAHGHPPLPPQHPPAHLEPISAATARIAGGRAGAGPSDPGLAPTDRPCTGVAVASDNQPPRSASFSSFVATQPPGLNDHHDAHFSPGASHAFPGHALATQALAPAASSQMTPGSVSPAALATAHGGLPGPPMLPGLFPTGRRGASFRNEASGLSGWDTDAPAVTHQPQSQQVAPNLTLWAGSAGSTLQPQAVGTAALGRASPISGIQPPPRREGSSRMHRAPAGPLVDLSLGPERSTEKAGQGGTSNGGRGSRTAAGGVALSSGLVLPPARSLSPDVVARGGPAGFSAPQHDALSEFCASRAELGSAGTAAGSMSGAAPSEGRSGSNANAVMGNVPVAMPMRVTSLTKATAVGRVS